VIIVNKTLMCEGREILKADKTQARKEITHCLKVRKRTCSRWSSLSLCARVSGIYNERLGAGIPRIFDNSLSDGVLEICNENYNSFH
jgi:hypothetical protein